MPSQPLPCEAEEEDEERAAIREILEEYDELMEECMTTRLSPRDQAELDELHSYLQEREQEHWVGVPASITDMLSEKTGMDFPMLRYILGHLNDIEEI